MEIAIFKGLNKLDWVVLALCLATSIFFGVKVRYLSVWPCIDVLEASGHFAKCGVSRNIPLQNPPRSLLADDHPITCDNLASGDRHHRPSGNLEALPRSVVGTMMQVLLSDRLATARIPQCDIGVEADADRPLSGVETVYFGVISRS